MDRFAPRTVDQPRSPVLVAADQLVCVVGKVGQDCVIECDVMCGGELTGQGWDVVTIVIRAVQGHDRNDVASWFISVIPMHHGQHWLMTFVVFL